MWLTDLPPVMELESVASVSALEALCAGAELVGEVRPCPPLPLVEQVAAQQRRVRPQETVLRHFGLMMPLPPDFPRVTTEAENETERRSFARNNGVYLEERGGGR